MSTAQRISRGFHRLGLLLAAIPLLIGVGFCLIGPPYIMANYALDRHQKLVCAHEHVPPIPTPPPTPKGPFTDEQVGLPLHLKSVGCSDSDAETVSYAEARNPPSFSWWTSYSSVAAPLLAIAAAVSLAVYIVVRAIGWIIGGFAAS
jgi:hypothetical protein